MNILQDFVRTLERFGVADVALPFFLVFAIVFGILEQINLFVKDAADAESKSFAKRINTIIALVMGLAVVFPHVISPNSKYDVVPIINKFLPWIAMVLIAVLGVIFIFGLITGKALSGEVGKYSVGIIVGIVLLVGFILFSATGVYRLPYWLNSNLIILFIAAGVFFWAISWITK